MTINDAILWLMAIFMLLGAVDRILGNRFGLGASFEEGIVAMGSLALAMLGILCLAPVLSGLLRPLVVPLYALVGADPAMFAGTILANDMGGASLAMELAGSREAGEEPGRPDDGYLQRLPGADQAGSCALRQDHRHR